MVSRTSQAVGSRRGGLVALLREHRCPEHRQDALVTRYYESLGTPVALSCWMLWKYQEHDQLVSKDVDPHHYNDAETFRRDFCAISFLRKNPFLGTTFRRKEAALKAFHEAEDLCSVKNKQLVDENWRTQQGRQFANLLSRQARKIDVILSEFDVESVLELGTWGPGTTLKIKGKDTSASRKYQEGKDITPLAYALFGQTMMSYCPSWTAWSSPCLVKGNTVCTVPKNAKTDRTIAAEPSLNSWLQLAVGKFIRKRLRIHGCDLNSDRYNQFFAKVGSLNSNIATIDFTQASDSISVEVVRELLPPRWFTVLDCLRSHSYLLDGTWKESSKFSTMGNGFTFELESLIFLTAAQAVCESLGLEVSGVSVFGDDVTIPVEAVPLFESYCAQLGFRFNTTKSFSSSYFRESCGAYWFKGINVKPLFLKSRISTIAELYNFANGVLQQAHRFMGGLCLDSAFHGLWNSIVDQIPQRLRLWGPASYGNQVLISPNRPQENLIKHDYWEGFVFSFIVEVPVRVENYSVGHLLAMLRQAGTLSELPRGNETELRKISRCHISRRGFVKQWYDFGLWL